MKSLGFLSVFAVLQLAGVLNAAEWEKWEEPKERAFSFYVPKGWTVSGGLKRPSLIGCVSPVEITSPDGKITIISTDEFPMYHELSEADKFIGRRIGERYTDEWGIRREIQNYAPGEKYLTRFLLPTRGDVQIIDSRKVSAVVQTPFPGLRLEWHGGEAEYRVKRFKESEERRGAALALTMTMEGEPRQWAVIRAFVYEAPAARMEEAKRVLLRAILTTRIRPEWLVAEMKGSRERMEIAVRTQREINDVFRQSYFDWQESRARMIKKTVDVIGDKLDVFDPEHGTIHYGVSNKHNYYWINRRGEIIGTNIDRRPDIDHRPLVVLP